AGLHDANEGDRGFLPGGSEVFRSQAPMEDRSIVVVWVSKGWPAPRDLHETKGSTTMENHAIASRVLLAVCLLPVGCGAEPTPEVTALAAAALSTTTNPALAIKRANPAAYDAPAVLGALPESICGSNDLQFVNAYNGLLGPSVSFVKNHKTSVGAM